MVYVQLINGAGQVCRGIKLRPADENDQRAYWTVIKSSRKGINRYELTLQSSRNKKEQRIVYNSQLRRERWSLVGRFHTCEEIAKLFQRRKVDPDANLPRWQRRSFWAQQNKPGTISYKQKQRLLQKGFDIHAWHEASPAERLRVLKRINRS